MVYVNFDQFDDELQRMNELIDGGKIALTDESLKISIEALNLRKAVTVALGTSMQDCLNVMAARHIGCLLVVDGKKLSGIFTERDVLLKIAGQDLTLAQEKIDDFMTPNPVAFKATDTIEMALRQMHKGAYRHVAVVNGGYEPIAVLSVRDIVDYIIEFFPQDVLNLPPHPIRIGAKAQYGA